MGKKMQAPVDATADEKEVGRKMLVRLLARVILRDLQRDELGGKRDVRACAADASDGKSSTS